MNPQTGRTLAPRAASGITQTVAVWHAGAKERKVESVKLRWRVSYKAGGVQKHETGEIPEFTLA